MKIKEFRSSTGGYCSFTDNDVTVVDKELQQAKVFPLGSIKKITSFHCMKIIAHNGETAFFTFSNMIRKNRDSIKRSILRINQDKSLFDRTDPYTVELDDITRTQIERLRKPHRSRRKAVKKFWVILTLIVMFLAAVFLIEQAIQHREKTGSGNYSSMGEETPKDWQNADDFTENRW